MLKNRRNNKIKPLLRIITLCIIISTIIFHNYFNNVFNEKTFEESNGANIVILTASKGAYGLGHTALLFETEHTWYYFSWQSPKVVFSEVPPNTMRNIDSFNSWISINNSLQNYIEDFDSAFLIKGNFSSSLIKAEKVFDNFLGSQDLSAEEKDLLNLASRRGNTKYNFVFNNCVMISYDLISSGIIRGELFGDIVDSPSIISNIAKAQFESYPFVEEFNWAN